MNGLRQNHMFAGVTKVRGRYFAGDQVQVQCIIAMRRDFEYYNAAFGPSETLMTLSNMKSVYYTRNPRRILTVCPYFHQRRAWEAPLGLFLAPRQCGIFS